MTDQKPQRRPRGGPNPKKIGANKYRWYSPAIGGFKPEVLRRSEDNSFIEGLSAEAEAEALQAWEALQRRRRGSEAKVVFEIELTNWQNDAPTAILTKCRAALTSSAEACLKQLGLDPQSVKVMESADPTTDGRRVNLVLTAVC
jgi:hypothetical protein